MLTYRLLCGIILLVFPVPKVRGWGWGQWGWHRRQNTNCLDLAIIGGGIGGTYTAWKLKDRGMSIEIFEQSNRIGGRLFSVFLPSMPNIAADLGAMRYIPGEQPIIESLIDELNLRSVPFKPSSEKILYYLRGTHFKEEELNTTKVPYRLKPDEPKDPAELNWKLYQRALNVSRPDEITDHMKAVTPDGKPLYQQGYLSVLGDVWSNEARAYLEGLGPFQTFYENINAVDRLPSHNPAFAESPERRTVTEGFSAFPVNLAKQFEGASTTNKVNMNKRVDAIKRVRIGQNTFYKLTIFDTKTVDGCTSDVLYSSREVCAEQVIIAGPRRAQELIKWEPLQNDPRVIQAMNAVIDFSALKIFMVYPEAWWDKLTINHKSLVTDLFLKQTMEFGRYTTPGGQKRAMLLHYADGETTVDYWNELRKFEGTISSHAVPAAIAVSKKIADHVHFHLADLFNIDVNDIPAPIDGVMIVWRDDPYGGGWHFYRPGFNFNDVKKVMKRPSKIDNVYVVSNSYAGGELGAWSEGSLIAAEEVLNEFFPQSDTSRRTIPPRRVPYY